MPRKYEAPVTDTGMLCEICITPHFNGTHRSHRPLHRDVLPLLLNEEALNLAAATGSYCLVKVPELGQY